MFKKIGNFFKVSRSVRVQHRALGEQPKVMEQIKPIKELGYEFNADGQLRKVTADGTISDEGFQFNISSDHHECQAHYEMLGASVTEHIYELLENNENLIRLPVPKDSVADNGTFVFASKDFDQRDTLLVLIQGSGAVRAGQWARSLIINDKLDSGTQIPYIREATLRNFGVLVMNPNDNYRNGRKIPHSSSSEEHAQYVWSTYVTNSKAKSIVVVAHSYGGLLTVMLAQKFKSDFEHRVKAVAMTDSVHSFSGVKITEELRKIGINWVANSAPVDTPMNTPDSDIKRISAGHPQHEMTSYSCMKSVFNFIDKQLKN